MSVCSTDNAKLVTIIFQVGDKHILSQLKGKCLVLKVFYAEPSKRSWQWKHCGARHRVFPFNIIGFGVMLGAIFCPSKCYTPWIDNKSYAVRITLWGSIVSLEYHVPVFIPCLVQGSKLAGVHESAATKFLEGLLNFDWQGVRLDSQD